MDFSKFDSMVDIDGLKQDIAQAEAGSGASNGYKDVPHGRYEVAVTKLELTETKRTGKPMATCWMRVVSDGEYKGSMIFMNQVITQGFQVHIMNEFLRSLLPEDSGVTVAFEGYAQYNDLLMDIAELVDGSYEYGLDYGQNNKGFDTFEITDIFEIEK